MRSTPESIHNYDRGLFLTDDAFQRVDEALTRLCEESNAPRAPGERERFTYHAKGKLLDMHATTVRRLYERLPLDKFIVDKLFQKLGLTFNKDEHCASAPLPNQPTPWIGRTDERAEIKDCLQSSRLVTLTGIGGIGKSRFAVQIGVEMKRDFPAGIWYVDLVGVTDPD